jgi:hypothetical protein
MRAKSVKFIAHVPNVELKPTTPQKVEFKLGVGPCSLYVYALEVDLEGHHLVITQHADNRLERVNQHPDLIEEKKVFVYKMMDVIGRVEMLSL